jgi:hypothetical protein
VAKAAEAEEPQSSDLTSSWRPRNQKCRRLQEVEVAVAGSDADGIPSLAADCWHLIHGVAGLCCRWNC